MGITKQMAQALPPFQLSCSSPRTCATLNLLLTDDLLYIEPQTAGTCSACTLYDPLSTHLACVACALHHPHQQHKVINALPRMCICILQIFQVCRSHHC